ncbi:4'-phosphopantetheinyl transferase family protein [Roseixanthobacter glucoisosaccharinicivorans]|uniref:4'-phosphopantetheinyl transferase family protein n=1 Tax=Roseixanthobacter glucoisosaccharinicivorans TaxID=3119923 RepID=UPI0037294DDC
MIELYLLALDRLGPREDALFAAVLDAEECARAARLRFARDRTAFIAAHALARFALSRARPAVPPAAWRFTAPPLGKPVAHAEGGAGVSFSLSHTAGLVAVVVSEDGPLGVDVEAIVPATATLDLATAFCAPAEHAALAALKDEAARARRFFALWTLKESLLKAAGLGLSQAPQTVQFAFDPFAVTQLSGAARGDWQLWSGVAPPGHCLAVCAGGEKQPHLAAYTINDGAALAAGAALPDGALTDASLTLSTCRSRASTV